MLWTIAVILLILWVLGFFVVNVGGGLIHLLLVVFEAREASAGTAGAAREGHEDDADAHEDERR